MPYPANYGGVYDVFYKLEALQKQGIKIHLHCFDYGRGKQTELNKYCVEVKYYKRRKTFSFSLPYIVSSRINQTLSADLLKDDFPILLEGVHCSYPLLDKDFSERKMLLRIFNAEFIYYKNLARHSKNIFKKLFFYNECRLLKSYEAKLAKTKATIIPLSQLDEKIYREQLHANNIHYVPIFITWKVNSKLGTGKYCLYHGDLSVSENEKAATWLIKNVFKKTNIPFIVAGKNPSKSLKKIISQFENVQLISNPSEESMQQLIADAQINMLPSFNNTGIKLKLINALFNGRYCVVNEAMIENTNFANLCHICLSADEMKMKVEELFSKEFTEAEVQLRKNVLETHFDNDVNAKKLIELIWS